MPKITPAALVSHMQGTQTTLCTVWQIKRNDDALQAFTDHDVDVVADIASGNGSVTHKAATAYDRSAFDSAAGFTVPNVEVTGLLNTADITAAQIRSGLYAGAEVWIARLNYTSPGQGVDRIIYGHIGRITERDHVFVAELRGLMKLYQNEIVDLVGPECRYDFKSFKCGYSGGAATCDKTWLTCQALGNSINFGGEPHLPGFDDYVETPMANVRNPNA